MLHTYKKSAHSGNEPDENSETLYVKTKEITLI